MWIMSTLIRFALLFSIFAATEGLECFACYGEDSLLEYEPTAQGDKGSSSCRYGNNPHTSLTETCPVSRDVYGKVLQPLCFTTYFTVASPELKRDLKMTTRQCVAAERTPGTGYTVQQKVVNCFKRSHKQIMDQGIDQFAKELPNLTDDTVFDFCYCNYDYCNPADGNKAGTKLAIYGAMASIIAWVS